MRDKQYFENKINASAFFSMDKDKEPSAYLREKDRLAENIFLYKIAESKENEGFGLEIMETFCDCVRFYDAKKGPFLHYFNRAFSLRKKKEKAISIIADNSFGIHLSEKERRTSGAVYKFLEKHPDISKEDLLAHVEEYKGLFGMTAEELKQAVILYSSTIIVSTQRCCEESENKSTFISILVEDSDIETDVLSKEMIENIIDICEEVYLAAREKTKRQLSVKITSEISELDLEQPGFDTITEKHFFDPMLYKMSLLMDKKLTNKDICWLLDISEPNLSQNWKRFLKKVKGKLSEEKEKANT